MLPRDVLHVSGVSPAFVRCVLCFCITAVWKSPSTDLNSSLVHNFMSLHYWTESDTIITCHYQDFFPGGGSRILSRGERVFKKYSKTL